MRQVALILVAAAVLAVPQAAAKPGVPSQLLAFVGSGRDVSVVKVDALTLKPVSRTAPLGVSNPSFVARLVGRVAITDGAASLRFIDLKRMRWEFRVAYPGPPEAAVWSYADKLVTLNASATAEVIVVDPTRRRLEKVRSLPGSLVAWAVAGDRIVALLGPLDGIGASKLAVIDDRGAARTVPLPQIRSGAVTANDDSTHTFLTPGLAVDKKRAVVVAPDGAVAEVRLDTLAVTAYASRALAAARKAANGSMRTARFVDENIVAVTGEDWSWDGTVQRVAPTGLTLVDTRDWSARKIDSTTRGVAPSGFGPGCIVCGGPLVAFGSDGLAGYDADGTLQFRLFAGTQVGLPLLASSYAYLPGANPATHFTVVDTWSGKIVKTVDTAKPTLLVPSWSY